MQLQETASKSPPATRSAGRKSSARRRRRRRRRRASRRPRQRSALRARATARSACRPTPTAASVPSSRARCFDAELKQERDEHHRGGDQEETEAEETERRTASCRRGGEALFLYGQEGHAERWRVDRRARIVRNLRRGRSAIAGWNAQQADRAPAAGPQVASRSRARQTPSASCDTRPNSPRPAAEFFRPARTASPNR